MHKAAKVLEFLLNCQLRLNTTSVRTKVKEVLVKLPDFAHRSPDMFQRTRSLPDKVRHPATSWTLLGV